MISNTFATKHYHMILMVNAKNSRRKELLYLTKTAIMLARVRHGALPIQGQELVHLHADSLKMNVRMMHHLLVILYM
jgi:hypothetical protein